MSDVVCYFLYISLCLQDELLDELEELEQEDLEKEILDIPPVADTLPELELGGLPAVRE